MSNTLPYHNFILFRIRFPFPDSRTLSSDLIRYGRPVEAGLQSIVTSMLLSGTGTNLRLVTTLSWISRHTTQSVINLGSEKESDKELCKFGNIVCVSEILSLYLKSKS